MIHVAGTKGKGSTCMFASSFLQAHGIRTEVPKSVGLCTSPHLISVRERLRITAQPVSEALFAKYFFDVWDTLELDRSIDKGSRYLQLLTLVSYHTFVSQKVNVAIYEAHSGGEFDSTNVLEPLVVGITSIGIDHIRMLGPSIRDIAWHKAGIFKKGSLAYSSPQEPAVVEVLENRAKEKEVVLEFVDINRVNSNQTTCLRPVAQRTNCSLAYSLVQAYLRKHKSYLSSSDVQVGATQFNWPGRFQKIGLGSHNWFLDGAHNEMSSRIAAQWFSEIVAQR